MSESKKSPPQKKEKKARAPRKSLLKASDIVTELATKIEHQRMSSSKMGVPRGWRKATFIVREEHFQKLKDIAYWERIPVKDILDQLLKSFCSTKKVSPAPKEKKDILNSLSSDDCS